MRLCAFKLNRLFASHCMLLLLYVGANVFAAVNENIIIIQRFGCSTSISASAYCVLTSVQWF